MSKADSRKYKIDDCYMFSDCDIEPLSNICTAFPLIVNNVRFPTVDTLYQSTKYSTRADIQRKIVVASNSKESREIADENLRFSRVLWYNDNVKIMRWCLQTKYYCNKNFADYLLPTGDIPLVYHNEIDIYWGTKYINDTLVGTNGLGRLLMELRAKINKKDPTLNDIPLLNVMGIKVYDRMIYSIG